jgi:hypothetical protein
MMEANAVLQRPAAIRLGATTITTTTIIITIIITE